MAALLIPQSDLVIRGVGLNPTRSTLLDFLTSIGAKIKILEVAEYDGKPYIEHVASRTEVRMPIIALAGIGAQQRVARRLAVRADAQALVYPFYPGVGVLLSVGVSVPIGRIEKRE